MSRGIILAVAVLGAIVGVLLFAWAFVPKSHTRIAERHQHIAQAICDFRAQNGLLPDDLQELVPTYLPAVSAASALRYYNGTLSIEVEHRTWVNYSFRGPNEGWVSSGDSGVGPLPVPLVTPSVVPVTGESLVRARLAVYDRRIGASSKGLRHRTEKISYLISLKRTKEAYAECLAGASVHPDWWRAQMGLATLAPQGESETAETRFCSWVEQHPAFIHYWYLARYYRDLGRAKDALAALRQGAKYPLEDVHDSMWVPHAFAFDAATFACKHKEPELVLAIADMWSSPRGVHNYPSPELPAFRAAAKLALGQFKEARVDADSVIATSRARAIWAGNLDQLDAAIRREDRSFVYDPGSRRLMFEWSLFPSSE